MAPAGSFQLGALVVMGMIAVGQPVAGDDDDPGRQYAVTVTNLTRGQTFTPVLVATHKAGPRLFELGQPASPELATLAEEGDTMPLAAALAAMAEVKDVVSSGALLPPGESVTIMVSTQGAFDHLSVAAMLIPTNDGFFALNGIEGPRGRVMMTLFSPAYDAGSERNDELCASIPGPFFAECGGQGGGGMPAGGEEGYVHIHGGIHGIGNFLAAVRDWRNPVAQITVQRVR
jgi:Spondin_N